MSPVIEILFVIFVLVVVLSLSRYFDCAWKADIENWYAEMKKLSSQAYQPLSEPTERKLKTVKEETFVLK